MKKIALLAAIMAALSLGGCENSESYAANGADLPVFQTVGTNPADGCTVTRFFRRTPGGIPDDRGFYTRCPAGQPTTTEHVENCGKNCTRKVTVTTIGTPDAQ